MSWPPSIPPHGPSVSAMLKAVEQWQRLLFEAARLTSSDQETAILGRHLGRAFLMRELALLLRLEELARALAPHEATARPRQTEATQSSSLSSYSSGCCSSGSSSSSRPQ